MGIVLNLSSLIKNKSVVFVGPSPILQTRKLGKKIEKFNTIIKTGGAINLNSNDYYRDYGKRIDILFCNRSFYREQYPFPIKKIKNLGVKLLIMRMCEDEDLKNIKRQIPVELFDREKIPVRGLPLLGAIIAKKVIENEPKKFLITGTDFNMSRLNGSDNLDLLYFPDKNKFSEYVNGYLVPNLREKMIGARNRKLFDSHDHLSNAKYIYSLFLQNKVELPDFILEKLRRLIKLHEGYNAPKPTITL